MPWRLFRGHGEGSRDRLEHRQGVEEGIQGESAATRAATASLQGQCHT
jgi:hypothetical protein